jgi:hypothetical protein
MPYEISASVEKTWRGRGGKRTNPNEKFVETEL